MNKTDATYDFLADDEVMSELYRQREENSAKYATFREYAEHLLKWQEERRLQLASA